jgi:hypothetical protein
VLFNAHRTVRYIAARRRISDRRDAGWGELRGSQHVPLPSDQCSSPAVKEGRQRAPLAEQRHAIPRIQM